MQIHELTQPRKSKLDEVEMFGQDGLLGQIGSAIRNPKQALGFTKDGKFSPGLAQQQADQSEYARTAATAAGKLQAQQKQAKSVTLDQAMAKLKANTEAQQWINGIVAQWTPAADKIAADKKAKTPTASIDEAVTLDPKDPAQAAILAKMGDPRFQPPPPPGASDPKQDLRKTIKSWINSKLKTTSLEAIVKAENSGLEGLAGVSQRIKKELDDMVNQDGNETAQQTALKNILVLVTAANHVVQANDPQAQSNMPTNRPATPGQGNVDTGLTDNQLYFLRKTAGKAGGPAPRPTGNEFYDSLIQQIRGG
jgi:hypothetical protein